MKVKDKVNELALFFANKEGITFREGFDFSSKLGTEPADIEAFKVYKKVNSFWAMALGAWEIVTGDTPDLEADWDDDDDS